jgi:hypothetical protein
MNAVPVARRHACNATGTPFYQRLQLVLSCCSLCLPHQLQPVLSTSPAQALTAASSTGLRTCACLMINIGEDTLQP